MSGIKDWLRRRHRRRRYLWWILACLVAIAHFASFDVVNQAVLTDVRYFLYCATQVVKGAVPHLDFFENKTQLATFAGAVFYNIGRALGVDPLTAIRVAYLGLAGIAGVLLFEIHRRLAHGRAVPGMLALLIYSGFPLLGVLPSIGNVPKMLMAVFASLTCLLVSDRRWILAGIASALAFMDWQIGALAVCAALGAALCERRQRLRSVTKVGLGALLGTLPFFSYYLAQGALGPTYRQIIVASLEKGSAGLTRRDFMETLEHLLKVIQRGCDGQEWLVAVCVIGMLVYPLWIRRNARPSLMRLMVALAIYHYGVTAYSLVDFQGYGDLFILLHSLAFFGGVAVTEIYRRFLLLTERRRGTSAAARQRRATFLRVAILVALALTVRPSLLRPRYTLKTPLAAPDVTLSDQREVTRQLRPFLRAKTIAFAESSEQLFLANRTNDLPFFYWNSAAHAYYRTSPEETRRETLYRMLRESDPDVVVSKLGVPADRATDDRFDLVKLVSNNGAYSVKLYVRRELEP